MVVMFRTRSGFLGSPRLLAELHVGAEWPRDIVLQRLAYSEMTLVRIQIDNSGGAAVATVGGLLSLRWRSSV